MSRLFLDLNLAEKNSVDIAKPRTNKEGEI